MLVRFIDFYSQWWNTQPSIIYPVIKPSNTGLSLWIIKNGKIICVPKICLVRV